VLNAGVVQVRNFGGATSGRRPPVEFGEVGLGFSDEIGGSRGARTPGRQKGFAGLKKSIQAGRRWLELGEVGCSRGASCSRPSSMSLPTLARLELGDESGCSKEASCSRPSVLPPTLARLVDVRRRRGTGRRTVRGSSAPEALRPVRGSSANETWRVGPPVRGELGFESWVAIKGGSGGMDD